MMDECLNLGKEIWVGQKQYINDIKGAGDIFKSVYRTL